MADSKNIVITGASSGIGAIVVNPVAEIYTNPQQAEVVRNYFQDVGAFERQATAWE